METKGGAQSGIERMEYHPWIPAADTRGCPGQQAGEPASPEPEQGRLRLEARIAALEASLAEKDRIAAQMEAAVREAHVQGRAEAASEQAEALKAWKLRMAERVKQFGEERDAYFVSVEQEVVRLALAIAARILHRESQMDPLLLSGVVRVALGQLAETSSATLRVPRGDMEMWEEMFRLMPGLPVRPRVEADARLETGDCILETRLGTVDLGVRAQLEELERGFFDLLELRPERPDEAKSGESGIGAKGA